MRQYPFVSVIAAVAALSLFGAGCFSAETITKKVQEKVAEGVASRATGGDVDVDTKNNAVTFKNAAGDVVQFGENVTIPADFPKDVPVYPGSKAASVVISSSGDKSSSLSLKSSDDSAKVVKWYEDTLKAQGWTQEQTMTAAGVDLRNYKKDGVQLSVTVTSGGEESTTVISLIRTPKEQ